MCRKCQAGCADCQRLIAEHGEDNLYECVNCGHLFVEVNKEGLCDACAERDE